MRRLCATLGLLGFLFAAVQAQIGVIGSRVPTTDSPAPPPPPPPNVITNLLPDNGATGIATNVTISCSAAWATSFTLVIDTVTPPVATTVTSPTCSFPQSDLPVSTAHYYKITASNATDTIDSAIIAFTTITPSSGVLATHQFTSTGWTTFGIPLPQGLAFGGLQVGALTTQTDVKTVHSDGSIKFAIVTANITSTGLYDITDSTASVGTFTPTEPTIRIDFTPKPGSTTYSATMPTGMGCTGENLWLNGPLVKECRFIVAPSGAPTPASHLRVHFEPRIYNDGKANVSVTVDNSINSTTANTLPYSYDIVINGASVDSRVATITAGPCSLSNSGVVATCTGHGLEPGDYLRLVSSTVATAAVGTFKRIISVQSANNFRFEGSSGPGNQSGATWEKVDFLHVHQARWRKRFNVGGFDEADIVPDLSTLYSSKVTFPVLSTIGSDAITYLNTGGTVPEETPDYENNWKFDILGIGEWHAIESEGGGREELGWRTLDVHKYLAHPESAALRTLMLKYADLYGSRKHHLTNASDDSMVDVNDHPNLYWFNPPASSVTLNMGGPAGGAPRGGYTPDPAAGAAHQPSPAFIPYILTGDRYYLEQVKHRAQLGIFGWGPGSRQGSQGLITGCTMRCIAWTIRDMVDAAAWAPDNDSHKAYFATLIQNNLNRLEEISTTYTADPVLQGRYHGAFMYEAGHVSKFMLSWLATALWHGERNGFIATGGGHDMRSRLVDYLVQGCIPHAAVPPYSAWDPIACGAFEIFGRRGDYAKPTQPLTLIDAIEPFGSWSEAWSYNYELRTAGNLATTAPGGGPCGTPETPACREYIGNYPVPTTFNTTHGAYIRMAIMVGLATGAADAQQAYDYVMSWPLTLTKLNDINYGGNGVGPGWAIASME